MPLSRRRFINRAGQDFVGLAAAVMLMEEKARAEGSAAAEIGSGGVLNALHHPARAKRVVQLFMAGAASHVDLWDHKPQLEKHHGEASNFGEHVEAFQDGLGPWMKSPFGVGGSTTPPRFLMCLSSSLVFQKMKVPIGKPLRMESISLADCSFSQTNSRWNIGSLIWPVSISTKSASYFLLWLSG